LWREDVARFASATWRFEDVRLHPKPYQGRSIPLVIGGNSDVALRRTARTGDGWYGFNLTPDAAHERVTTLRELLRREGRPAEALHVAVAPVGEDPDRWARLEAIGVDEAVVVAVPPDDVRRVPAWLDTLPSA
jgi:alkanesulfonate monooxygenase SsuD/methylene tetrahydromethanopterin reductase-like flavin-dependent oxidoreductase (luciferase family)